MKRNKIIWSYWQNPYGDDTDEFVDEDKAEVLSPWEEKERGGDKATRIRPVISTWENVTAVCW